MERNGKRGEVGSIHIHAHERLTIKHKFGYQGPNCVSHKLLKILNIYIKLDNLKLLIKIAKNRDKVYIVIKYC